MSNILERHLEQNIEPNTSKESYIDQAIQIFQDMKEEDITKANAFKSGNKYCLCGLVSKMTGFRGYDTGGSYSNDINEKLGLMEGYILTGIHKNYIHGRVNFEQMRQEAIEYMESLK